MAAVNGIMKKSLVITENAQDLVVTLNSLHGHHALSLVFLLTLKPFTSNTARSTSSLEIKVANLSALKTEVVIHTPLNVIECAKSLLGVTGLPAPLLTAGVSAEESVRLSCHCLLVMKFVLNCIRLIDATMNLLQITALGPPGVTGVSALLVARLPRMYQFAEKNAT
jgi:hypothetical protein